MSQQPIQQKQLPIEEQPDRTYIWKDADRLPYHLTQFESPYRSTVFLAKYISETAGDGQGSALDVACGAGANIFYLNRAIPGYKWTGVDLAGDVLFPIGRREFEKARMDVELVTGDLYKLTDVFPSRKFDLVVSTQTLMALPTYDRALEQLLAVTRRWLFITSLFTESRVDAKIELMDYSRSPHCQGPFYYNVYCLEKFKEFCEARGCVDFRSEEFEIDIDLEPPASRGLGTYTRKTAEGRRVQFSGPLLMPWMFVAVRMG